MQNDCKIRPKSGGYEMSSIPSLMMHKVNVKKNLQTNANNSQYLNTKSSSNLNSKNPINTQTLE